MTTYRIDLNTHTLRFDETYTILLNGRVSPDEFKETMSKVNAVADRAAGPKRAFTKTILILFVVMFLCFFIIPLFIILFFALFAYMIYGMIKLSEVEAIFQREVREILDVENQKYAPRGIQLLLKYENRIVGYGRDARSEAHPYLELLIAQQQQQQPQTIGAPHQQQANPQYQQYFPQQQQNQYQQHYPQQQQQKQQYYPQQQQQQNQTQQHYPQQQQEQQNQQAPPYQQGEEQQKQEFDYYNNAYKSNDYQQPY